MIKDILFESRHKFIYFEENKRDELKKECLDFIIDINQPIPVYIKDNGLSEFKSLFQLDKYRIIAFHDRYYDFLIALSVIDVLINTMDKDRLNHKLKRLLEMYSNGLNINNIDDLRCMLEYDKNIYVEGYKKYLDTGKIDFYDNLKIGFISLDIFLKNIKRNTGVKGYFSIFLDYDDLSIDCMRTINKHINSRCNGYLSINVICGNNKWGTYYDNMGYIIQNVHDYDEIDYRNIKKRSRYN